jgi:hypothetical protein
MRPIILASVVIIAATAGEAAAQCASATLVRTIGATPTAPTLSSTLTAKLVCGRPAAAHAGAQSDRWQEEHIKGGALFAYRKGPGDPVDPRAQVGTWSVQSGNVVMYNYSGGGSYGRTLHNNGSHYSFCTAANGTELVRAYIVTSSTGCAGNYPP